MSTVAHKALVLARRSNGLSPADLSWLSAELVSRRESPEHELLVAELMTAAAELGSAHQASGDAILLLCAGELPALRSFRGRAPESHEAKAAWAKASGVRHFSPPPPRLGAGLVSAARLVGASAQRLR
ncbi:MAG: hypothetical protein HYV07_08480 [Deltaproteobacteria bacterium]|nr:hypothetical protein [Deltaproteobacteria bacterium]